MNVERSKWAYTRFFLSMKEISEQIMSIINEAVTQGNAQIYDIIYKKEGSRKILGLLLDKDNGINLDECASINRQISNVLEEQDLIDDNYVVEVSSPGLDRPMRTKEHYQRSMGQDIEVNLYAPIGGKKKFSGKLLGMTEDTIVIETEEGVSTEIKFKDISKAKWKI